MYEGYIVGIFPRNDILIDTWKKWERGEAGEDTFKDELDKALDEVVKTQKVARLTYIHDPQIDWHDMFRPFTDLDNIEAGPLTRFFENNTFYRKPVIKGLVKYEEGFITNYLHIDKLPKNRRWIATLPGPYTFYRLSEYRSEKEGRKSIVNMVLGASIDLMNEGYEFVTLAEPALAYYSDVDWGLVNEFYSQFREYRIRYRVHLYFGDVKDKVDKLIEIAPYGFSIDTSYTDIWMLPDTGLETIILGVVDAQNTLMENVDDLVNNIKRFFAEKGIKKIVISNNTDLDFLPYEVAQAKLMLLSEVLRRLGA